MDVPYIGAYIVHSRSPGLTLARLTEAGRRRGGSRHRVLLCPPGLAPSGSGGGVGEGAGRAQTARRRSVTRPQPSSEAAAPTVVSPPVVDQGVF